MSGLYIHIPFCKSRCTYCGFYSSTNLSVAARYIDALINEMKLRQDYIPNPPATIYLGGGTPSQLSAEMLQRLFDAIDTNEAEEITIECNPDDVTPEFAQAISSMPVNRVSMGAQTFDNSRLRFLHRRHKAPDVSNAVELLRNAGIENISIDLMYGFPDETIEQWRDDIRMAISIAPEHISAYCLSYEEGTPLYIMREKGKISETDEETCRTMYYELVDRMEAASYEHYEISNFARRGLRSRHNSGYWQGTPYIGIGAAAHSFDTMSRQWNVADINAYMTAIEHDEVPAERETLDIITRYNDTVMLSLRTREGINIAKLERDFGSDLTRFCMKTADKYLSDRLLVHTDGHLRLTRNGLFISDMIMSDLMKV